MKVTDLIGCTAWAFLLVLATTGMPVIGPFLGLFAPLPFLFYSTKSDLSQGLAITVSAILVISALGIAMGQRELILLTLQFGATGFFISLFFKKNASIGMTVFGGALIMVTISAILLIHAARLQGVGVQEMVYSYLKAQVDTSISEYKKMGVSPDQVTELTTYSFSLIKLVANIYPALMIVFSGLVVWINVLAARPLFRMNNLPYPDFGEMDRWKTPENLVWLLIVSGFALFLTSGGLRFFFLNLFLVMMAIYFFHGLAVLLFFLNKYRVTTWMRIIIYSLLVLQQVFMGILALVGLFDLWVDFRKLQKPTAS